MIIVKFDNGITISADSYSYLEGNMVKLLFYTYYDEDVLLNNLADSLGQNFTLHIDMPGRKKAIRCVNFEFSSMVNHIKGSNGKQVSDDSVKYLEIFFMKHERR